MSHSNDALDLREIGAALRRGWLWVAAGGILGLAAGGSTLYFLRPEYKATATVLLRAQVDGSQSILSRLSGLTSILPSGMGGGSEVETEVRILTSRTVIGQVVDSLGLQADVLEPRGAAPSALFTEVRVGPTAVGAEYRFVLASGGYEVEGPGASGMAVPGEPYPIPGGSLMLRGGELPGSFVVSLRDREDAITRVAKNVATEASGEYVELAFRAYDPTSAAAVPNALLAEYLRRRKTTDRGVNQYRYEFLTEHTDSIARQLVRAETELRRYQEQSGVLDPELAGQADLERLMQVRGELETAATEARALRGIIEKSAAGSLSPREIAAYPTFLRNQAVNDLLSRLLELETERTRLLEKRTERDPEVVTLSDGIRHLEGRLVELARDYLSGLNRQEAELRRDLSVYEADLGALPRHAEEILRRIREVKRLSETLIALQAQLVQARLGAISEGGEVRQVDVAVPPRKPAFPSLPLNLLGGLLGGLFFGMVAAVGAARARQQVHEPWEAELATGVPAVRFDPRLPLWFGGIGGERTVLLLPAGPSAEVHAVGARLAATAAVQGRDAVLADLAHGGGVGAPARVASVGVPVGRIVSDAEPAMTTAGEGYAVYRARETGEIGGPHHGGRSALGDLEGRFSLVVAALPAVESASAVSVLAPDRPVVVVARAGEVTRSDLRSTVEICERLGVTVAGIVLQPRVRRGG